MYGAYFHGAIAHGAKPGDYILRITSDCPLIDAGLVDQGVKECIEGNYDQYGLYDTILDLRNMPMAWIFKYLVTMDLQK